MALHLVPDIQLQFQHESDLNRFLTFNYLATSNLKMAL